MASVDIQPGGFHDNTAMAGPRTDHLGRGLFTFHAIVGLYLLFGWLVPEALALAVYLVLLPAVAVQWLLNGGSCILNNFETWLRHGRWRDPRNPEEGGFLSMLSHWLFRWGPSRATLDALSYSAVAMLWLLGFCASLRVAGELNRPCHSQPSRRSPELLSHRVTESPASRVTCTQRTCALRGPKQVETT